MDAPPSTSSFSSRLASARGLPLSLAERVALYCHQTTAANNAGVLRNVPKPTTDEMSEFLSQRRRDGVEVYADTSLVRLLLTDSDYDAVCRDVLSLQDAIEWHAKKPLQGTQHASTPTLSMLLMSATHVFTEEEICAAHALAMSRGMEEVLGLPPDYGRVRVEGNNVVGETMKQQPRAKEEAPADDEQETVERTADLVDDIVNGAMSTLVRREPPSPDELDSTTHDAHLINDFVEDVVSLSVQQCNVQAATTGDREGIPDSMLTTSELQQETETALAVPCEVTVPATKSMGSEEHAGIHEDETMDLLPTGCDSYASERHEITVNLEWVKSTAEAASEAAIHASAKQLASSQFSDQVDQELKTNDPIDRGEVGVIGTLPRAQDESITAKSLAVSPPTACPIVEAEPGIDAIVRKLDAVLVDREEGDPDDVTFGKDAFLLKSLVSASVHIDTPTGHSTNLDGDRVEGGLHTITPTPLFHVGDSIEAELQGGVHYVAETIVGARSCGGTYDVTVRDANVESRVTYGDGDVESHLSGDLTRVPVVAIVTDESFTDIQQVLTDEVYHVGDDVEARYRGLHRHFPGKIAVVRGGGRYDMPYADDDYEGDVAVESIRPLVVGADLPPQTILHLDGPHTSGEDISGSMEQVETGGHEEAHVEEVVLHEGSKLTTGGEPSRTPTCVPGETGEITPVTEFELGLLHRGEDSRYTPTKSAEVVHRLPEGKPSKQREDADIKVDLLRHDYSRKRKLPPEITDPLHSTSSTAAERLHPGYLPQDSIPLHVETTPVVPFKWPPKRASLGHDESASDDVAVITTARALLRESEDSDEDSDANDLLEDDDEGFALDQILHTTARVTSARSRPTSFATPRPDTSTSTAFSGGPSKKKTKPRSAKSSEQQTVVPAISPSPIRYLSPQREAQVRTPRPKTGSHQTLTPRVGTPSKRARTPSRAPGREAAASWRELEEWRNVDLILSRKRRVVHNGHVGASDVPWGEEFAAIQSLKRFAVQYPEVLRDHIECQLTEVVSIVGGGATARSASTQTVATAARDALLLVKDLAFLLRHRLAPFFDAILPVVLPAVFHSHKRFLCETAYDVLEALVTHCSNRRLVVALLRQAQRVSRDDLRLVNLTCLYVEKCLPSLSTAEIHELLTKSATTVLDAIADLLTCKSAACQSSLQKSLLVLQTAVGEDVMERLLTDHIAGNELALVRRHLLLAHSVGRGSTKSPSSSPRKLPQQQQLNGATPTKQALVGCSTGGGGRTILQRMLAQRQNRVVPAPE